MIWQISLRTNIYSIQIHMLEDTPTQLCGVPLENTWELCIFSPRSGIFISFNQKVLEMLRLLRRHALSFLPQSWFSGTWVPPIAVPPKYHHFHPFSTPTIMGENVRNTSMFFFPNQGLLGELRRYDGSRSTRHVGESFITWNIWRCGFSPKDLLGKNHEPDFGNMWGEVD